MENAAANADEPKFTYRPLVAKGEDRAAKLAEVIERWATETAGWLSMEGELVISLDDIRRTPSALVGYDLRDDNDNAMPIDLGRDLLFPLSERLLGQCSDDLLERPLAVAALIDCHITSCDASKIVAPYALVISGHRSLISRGNWQSATILGPTIVSNAAFGGTARFEGAVFGAATRFEGVVFRDTARFHNAVFKSDVQFGDTVFGRNAYFNGSEIAGVANFYDASFGGRLQWSDADFYDDVLFGDAEFGEDVRFDRSKFHQSASYDGARFRKHVSFAGVDFCGDVFFTDATFLGGASFDEVDCSSDVSFDRARHIGEMSAVDVKSLGELSFQDADLRRSLIEPASSFLRTYSGASGLRLNLTDIINWRRVRSLGELSAFTRISYFALAGVPLLAGVWGPLRRGFAWLNGTIADSNAKLSEVLEHLNANPSLASPDVIEQLYRVRALLNGTLPETMPISWLLAFLAAFAVVIAQLIYQLRAPELIREVSEDELIERANERNRIDGEITVERLREAVGYLYEAAQQLPHRHSAWFVRRHKRTVWIPNRLEFFEDALVDDERGETIAADQEVSSADRKRIAIEEGQKARYATAAFENRVAAWISGGLYVLAIWLLLMIVFRQLAYIAEASAAPKILSSLFYVLSCGPCVGLGAEVIVLITALGAIVVDDPRWWDWGAKWLTPLRSWRGRGAEKAER
jgi:hypothetical protein